MNKRKEIFLLIGQKGSGKSFIGSILEKEFGIKFIRVEDWAKQVRKNRAVNNEAYLNQVFQVIENGIRNALNDIDKLVFESTGLTDYFDQMLVSLKKDFKVTTIGIYADNSICLDRVRTRDQTIHINISDSQVTKINDMVRERDYQTDFRINNESKTEKALMKELEKILVSSQS
jgi:shikimate kinase